MGVIRIDKWTLPAGQVLRRVLRSDPTQEYFVYVPQSRGSSAPLLVTVHGRSRNAQELAEGFSEYCEAYGVVLIAPHFSADSYTDYQRLGRRGRRADHALDAIVREGATLTGAAVDAIYLFGFSGGAQFAHRYAMAHPDRVAGVVVAASGWYTFPDIRRRFPYGIRPHRDLPDVVLDPEEFLEVPMFVVIGEKDCNRGKALRTTERLDAQQGATRLERALNWVKAMQAAALAYNIESQVELVRMAGLGHSFRRFMRRGTLDELVFSRLFSAAARQQPRQGMLATSGVQWREADSSDVWGEGE